MWSSGARSSRGGDLARDAAESYRRATYDDDAREVELWLTTHPTN
jgi:hypothetical protein